MTDAYLTSLAHYRTRSKQVPRYENYKLDSNSNKGDPANPFEPGMHPLPQHKLGREMDTAEWNRSWRKGKILISCLLVQVAKHSEIPFHFAFPCHSLKASTAQEHRHGWGWSCLGWQHNPAAQDKVSSPHVHPTHLCPVKLDTLPHWAWLSSPQMLGSCDIKLRIGRKSWTDTEMLHMAPARYIHLSPSQEGTSLSVGNLCVTRFITGQGGLMKPGLLDVGTSFGPVL